MQDSVLNLTTTDYAHIGYGMVGFSHIERGVLLLCITLTEYETETLCAPRFSDVRFQSLLKAGLNERFNRFLKLYTRNLGEDSELAELRCIFPIITRSRDCFVHGLWERTDNENLIVQYPSRAAIRDGRLQDKLEFTNQELESLLDLIAKTVIKCTELRGNIESKLESI